MNKILLIGCGHMGSALLENWYKKTSHYFTIVDPNQYQTINQQFKRRVSAFNSINKIKSFKKFDIIIFAVKPQIAQQVIKQFSHLEYKKNVLFISIVAGKKISFFIKKLNKKNQFIRVMPNMPAFIAKGMTCLVSNKLTTRKNKNIATALFRHVGKVLWLKNENLVDKVTAISGSGPGYIFLFVDLLEKSALKLGLKKKIARELIYQTIIGSMQLLINKNESAEQFTKKIAIKGGTTEAAIRIFNKKNQFKNIIFKAINAAYKRALKLGKE